MNSANKEKSVWSLGLFLMLFVAWACAADENVSEQAIQPEALTFCQIRSLQEAEPNLTGQDVVVAAVCRSMTYRNGLPQDDYRFNMAHQSMKESQTFFQDGSLGFYGLSDHATAVGGILVGFDPYGFHPQTGRFFYKGVCPNATIEVYEFWRFVSLAIFGKMGVDADVVTLSLGDLYEDWWSRGINRLVEQTGILVVASAGNGQRVYDQVLYPAAGANVLAVGVIDAEIAPDGTPMLGSFSLPRKQHTSAGPTGDRRCKPDLVAPGRAIVPVAFDTIEYEIAGDYSSLAAPIVSGTAALLIEEANRRDSIAQRLGTEAKNCVLKAILMTSARKLPWWHKGAAGSEDDTYSPLDYLQGAGLLDAMGAYRLLAEGNRPQAGLSVGWDNIQLSNRHPAAVYPIWIDQPQGQFLTATISWNRPYEDKYPFHAIEEQDSDLRLELWAVDLQTSQRVLLDISDSPVDTIEHLYVPLSGEYQSFELIVAYSESQSVREPVRAGLAWSVGPDGSADNPWWYDLNEDGRIDETDKTLYFILEEGRPEILDQPSVLEVLNLSAERSALLTKQWDLWKTCLGLWQQVDKPNIGLTDKSGN